MCVRFRLLWLTSFFFDSVEMEGGYFTASFFREAQAAAVAQQWKAASSSSESDGSPAKRQPPALTPSASSSEGFSPDVEAHLRRISSTVAAYTQQVVAGLLRTVPKAVVYAQITPCKSGLLSKLYQQMGSLSEEQLKTLLGEDATAVEQRRVLTNKLRILKRARDDVQAALA
jgi:Dynamin GTPase effector domain